MIKVYLYHRYIKEMMFILVLKNLEQNYQIRQARERNSLYTMWLVVNKKRVESYN